MIDWVKLQMRRAGRITDYEIEEAGTRLPTTVCPQDIELNQYLDRHHRQFYTLADQHSERLLDVERSCKAHARSPKYDNLVRLRWRLQQEVDTLFRMFMMSVQHAHKIYVANHMIQVRRGWALCLVPNVQTVRVIQATHHPEHHRVH